MQSSEKVDKDADVDLNICGDVRDLQKVARAMQHARQEVQLQQASRGAWYLEILPGPLFHTRQLSSVQRFITAFGNTYFHAAGTCPISLDDGTTTISEGRRNKALSSPSGVVDQSLRVIGVEGLRIADASVVPLNGLPNAPIQSLCMVIGLKCAKLIQG